MEWIESDEVAHFDYAKSRLVPFPKKGDLNNRNNGRGINLLNMGSKALRIILNMRAQKI